MDAAISDGRMRSNKNDSDATISSTYRAKQGAAAPHLAQAATRPPDVKATLLAPLGQALAEGDVVRDAVLS